MLFVIVILLLVIIGCLIGKGEMLRAFQVLCKQKKLI